MMCFRRAHWCAPALLLASALWGCEPGGASQADDEREPHFLMGRKLVQQVDYEGAVEAYEQALQVNPHSAAAHFELAVLYEDKENDPAAAIYHYERFLKLAPTSGNADVAQVHINNCKLELAKSASAIAPISASDQRALETLMQENRQLKADLARLTNYVSHLSNAPAPAVSPVTNPPAPPPPATTTTTAVSPSRAGSGRDSGGGNGGVTNRPATARRTHVVAAGETMAAIARRYGVSVPALQSANPQVEPRRMRPGTTLNIPGP